MSVYDPSEKDYEEHLKSEQEKCPECSGSGHVGNFADPCRWCAGTGRADNEHCMKCGNKGLQHKTPATISGTDMQIEVYTCGLCNPPKCSDCCGTGKDEIEHFFDKCRRCQGTGLASEEHCVRCGKRGPQCKPFTWTNSRGERCTDYCGID